MVFKLLKPIGSNLICCKESNVLSAFNQGVPLSGQAVRLTLCRLPSFTQISLLVENYVYVEKPLENINEHD